MSKHLKWLSLALVALALALVAVIPTAAAPSQAVAGTIALDKAWVTQVGSTVTVTVTDADLNVANTITNEATDFTGAGYAIPAGLANLGTWTQRVKNFPILDKNGDGVVNFLDVTTSIAGAGVWSVDASGGLVTFQNTSGAAGAGQPFTVTYNAAGVNEILSGVKVYSTNDPIGFTLALRETGPNTGIFTATFKTDVTTGVTVATFDETVLGVDVNGNGNTLDAAVASGFWEAKYAVDLNMDGVIGGSVTTALNEPAIPADPLAVPPVLGRPAVDLNGDGDMVDLAVPAGIYEAAYNFDFNRDGDKVDFFTSFPAYAWPTAASRPTIGTSNGTIITASYTDANPAQTVTASATVETQGPAFANMSPANGYATATTTQTLFVDVTDAQSGVVSTAGGIVFQMGLDNGAGALAGNGILDPTEVVAGYTPGAVVLTAITGGFRAQTTTAVLLPNNYLWNVVAFDNAGNQSTIDTDSTTAGSQAMKLTIDTSPPVFNCAPVNNCRTGQFWDTSVTPAVIGKNKATSLSVMFDSALNGATVAAADFTVGGVTPLDAFWTSSAPDTVFLTVPALAANATPTVAVVGSITDAAGNAMVPASITEKDGIAPTLTVSLDKKLSKDKVIATIVSNEPLAGLPAVTLDEFGPAAAGSPLAVPAGTNQWTWTYTPGVNGSYVIKVTGTDGAGNVGNLGQSRCTVMVAGVCTTPNSKFPVDGTVFEIDSSISGVGGAPNWTVMIGGLVIAANNAAPYPTIYTQNPFVVVDFTNEGKEYGYTAANVIGLASAGAAIVTDTDSYGKGTIATATMDGTAGTASGDAASVKYVFSNTGLALGQHVVTINGTDEAGNTLAAAATYTFNIAARPAYSIPLFPGMSLVSFPANPAKTGIADVAAGTGIDLIVTYDPSAIAGPWLIAQKGSDGKWTGTLSAVDNMHAYWVRSTSTAPITFDVPDKGFQELPPSIPVAAGWNLVPVVSVSGGAAPNYPQAAGTAIPAASAFSGITVSVAYGFNVTTGNWDKVPAGGNVNIGQGYWIYTPAKGTITP